MNMTITNSGKSELTINGTIKSIEDSMALREAVQKLFDSGEAFITLRIVDSFAMPSAVIGYLMKLVNRDKARLAVICGDKRLCELLDELQLTKVFGVSYHQFL